MFLPSSITNGYKHQHLDAHEFRCLDAPGQLFCLEDYYSVNMSPDAPRTHENSCIIQIRSLAKEQRLGLQFLIASLKVAGLDNP